MKRKEAIGDLLGGILLVAGITSVLTRPSAARDIEAMGNAFSASIRAAMGNVDQGQDFSSEDMPLHREHVPTWPRVGVSGPAVDC